MEEQLIGMCRGVFSIYSRSIDCLCVQYVFASLSDQVTIHVCLNSGCA